MKQTQKRWVIKQLRQTGQVTRNQALANYISRLGAIILSLKKEGWDITAENKGSDYVYTAHIALGPKLIYNPKTNSMVYATNK